jgi:hypothetical protein
MAIKFAPEVTQSPGQAGAFGKDARKFRDHIDRELWDVERKSPKHSEKFKERISNATRIYTQGRNEEQPPYCIHTPEA